MLHALVSAYTSALPLGSPGICSAPSTLSCPLARTALTEWAPCLSRAAHCTLNPVPSKCLWNELSCQFPALVFWRRCPPSPLAVSFLLSILHSWAAPTCDPAQHTRAPVSADLGSLSQLCAQYPPVNRASTSMAQVRELWADEMPWTQSDPLERVCQHTQHGGLSAPHNPHCSVFQLPV